MNELLYRAAQAVADINSAVTPYAKAAAIKSGLTVKTELEKQIGGDQALNAFKSAKPQSAVGVWNGVPRFIFMVRADGSTPAGEVTLPDGSKVVPIQGQVPVPENQAQAMIARGWKRMNSVMTELNTMMRDPARPNE